MNTLIQAIEALLSACRVKDQDRERWLTLQRECSNEQVSARQKFLAADYDCAMRAGELGKAITDLRDIFCLEIAVDSLPDDLKRALRRVIAERRMDSLLAPFKAVGLGPLGAAWRNAARLLDAAQSINEYGRREDADLEFEALRKSAESYRNPESWTKAVTVCELQFEKMRHGDQDRRERIGDAIAMAVRHLQKAYDQLTEQLQTMLEDLHHAGALGTELEELDPDLRRFLQDALGGLVRQRQTQTGIKRKTQTVTTVEAEAEAEGQSDEDAPDADRS